MTVPTIRIIYVAGKLGNNEVENGYVLSQFQTGKWWDRKLDPRKLKDLSRRSLKWGKFESR